MDFSEVNTLQTRLDDAEKQLATAQLEVEQLKEKLKHESARLRKRWKDDTDSLKSELHRANKEVEYLTRRVEDERTMDTAALVSETVKATLEQFTGVPLPPSSDKLPKIPHMFATPAKTHERTATAGAAFPSGSGTRAQFSPNKYQAEAKQDSDIAKAKSSAAPSAQRIPAVFSNIQPARPPSPNAMDWSPSELPAGPGRFEAQQRNASQRPASAVREAR